MHKVRLGKFGLAGLGLCTFLLMGSAAWPHGKKAWPAPKEAKALKNPVAPSESALAAGKAIYEKNCASCHGISGDGKGSMAAKLSEKPTDFTDAHMMHEMTDGEIFWKISEGRDPMPGFKKQLSEEQRWQLVHYLRSVTSAGPPSHRSHQPK